ncbi:hypothetical protein OPT61_g4897 [Boeremia exigua]|uniref:Uncharacterized protein n=1 Tax=Boeremia exigua TaxID=749465 RepID=A0ACC2ICC7_9PLEO|nr:hypothetical protein OPT61_g4897 [Boeremia exigua]
MILLTIAFAVILPFLTYYVTSALFFRKANSTAINKEPPTIPYFVPGLFNAANFGRSGARTYFAELIKDFGTFSPFKVRAGLRSYVVIRDPIHMSRVLNAPEHLTTTTSDIETFDKLFGSPNLERYLKRSRTSNRSDEGKGTRFPPPSVIPDATLISTTEAYISILSANMHDKMFQLDTWTCIEDLWSFLQLVFVRCTLNTLFGSTLLKKYPRLVRDYLEFEAATEGFVHGMPRLMISGATSSRDRIHQGLRNWMVDMETNREKKQDSGESNAAGSAWSEATGMAFICEHYRAWKVDSSTEGGFKDRAAEILRIIHTTNSRLVSSTFWTTVETLRKSHLTRNMAEIVGHHLSPITHKYDISGLIQEPLVKSLQAEVCRLRTATCAIRTNETDGFPLDKHWSLRKGTTVSMFSRDLALNTDLWKKAQPRALEKPLEEFWAERFERKNKSKKNVAAGDSDTEDIGSLIARLTTNDQYPGAQFISALQMATVAVFFAEFEIQLCDTELVDASLPPVEEFAYEPEGGRPSSSSASEVTWLAQVDRLVIGEISALGTSPFLTLFLAEFIAKRSSVKEKCARQIHGLGMTFEEKVLLLAGSSFWETAGIERLGIPRMKLTDGPNGARGENFKEGVKSACFPAGVALGASFNNELAGEIGRALAQETETKGARVLLGPTVCPHRHPIGGRNFESFSEDPLLAGRLASHYIDGVQGEGIGATIKHFAANEQETNRSSIDARVGERALREIYLKPFEIAIKASQPYSIMTSYNVVNGTHADSNEYLLKNILRDQWGYDGQVVGDWGGLNSLAVALNAGLDLEMPGPASWRTTENIQRALDENEVTMETLETRVLENLKFLHRSGGFDHPISPERAEDLPEHRALIRRAGAEGSVLLKNKDNLLPLVPENIGSIAMLGLAKQCLSQGGGSAAVNPHRAITPYEAFEEALGGRVKLSYAEGANVLRNLPPCSEGVTDAEGKPGFSFQSVNAKGETGPTTNYPDASFRSRESTGMERIVLTGTYTPRVSGNHYISLATLGNTKVYINDELVFNVEGKSADVYAILLGVAIEDQKRYEFVADQPYRIRLEASTVPDPDAEVSFMSSCLGFNFGLMEQHLMEADLLQEAIETAKSADVAVVFVGNTQAWETEGCDRDSMDLPRNGSFDELIAAVAAVNPNTVVVNSTGSPISMPWIDAVGAVLQVFFPGQEAGYTIADIIFGSTFPGGKLPVTFPKQLSDTPAWVNFPGDLKADRVEYNEGIYIGYRHYDRNPETVLFPFGFGLSYTTFEVHNVSISSTTLAKDQVLQIEAAITNSGTHEGSEILQVYVGPTNVGAVDRPVKELKGYAKTRLAPGAQEVVSILLDSGSFSYFDESKGKWSVDAGKKTQPVDSGMKRIGVHPTVPVEWTSCRDSDTVEANFRELDVPISHVTLTSGLVVVNGNSATKLPAPGSFDSPRLLFVSTLIMQSKPSLGVNVFALLCSSALVGIGIAAIHLSSEANDIFTTRFPPGSYGWSPSHWYGDTKGGFSILIGYDRSSEIKTYFAGAVTLVVGLLGTFAFGLSVKRPATPLLSKYLTSAAAFACIVAIVCTVWSAVSEVNIKHDTCWFEPASPGHQYWCSIENAACNTLRFTDDIQSIDDHKTAQDNYEILDKACLQFRHARYLTIPLAAISLVLTGLYAAQIWLNGNKASEDEEANARVRALQQDD